MRCLQLAVDPTPTPHFVLCACVLQVALRTKGIQFSQYPVEDEASLTRTLQQLLADSTVRGRTHRPTQHSPTTSNNCWPRFIAWID